MTGRDSQAASRARAGVIKQFALLVVAAIFWTSGCKGRGTPSPIVGSFGSSASPDGSKRLEVTRREKSLVDFEVIDATTGRRLTGDYIGSDAMTWFLYWESSTRLWGYGSDLGYFKLIEFKPDGTVVETLVDRRMAVPPVVWENLPGTAQQG